MLVRPLTPASYNDWIQVPTARFKEKSSSSSDVMEVEFYEAKNEGAYAWVYVWKMGRLERGGEYASVVCLGVEV